MRSAAFLCFFFLVFVEAKVFFSAPLVFAVGHGPSAVAAGDLNSDGVPDVAVACSFAGSLSVLLGAGNGSFFPAQSWPLEAAGAEGLALGRFGHEAHLGAAVANARLDSVSLLAGDGSGALEASAALPVGRAPRALALADLNEDGGALVVCLSRSSLRFSYRFALSIVFSSLLFSSLLFSYSPLQSWTSEQCRRARGLSRAC
jgi:hypothetical protein